MRVEINVRPMYDEQGYQSESYAAVSVAFGEVWYQFLYVVVEYVRNDGGQIIRIDVSTNPEDYELAHPDDAKLVGSIDVAHDLDGDELDLALAAFLLTNPAARVIPFDVC